MPRGLLHGYDYSDFLTVGHQRMVGAANHGLGASRKTCGNWQGILSCVSGCMREVDLLLSVI